MVRLFPEIGDAISFKSELGVCLWGTCPQTKYDANQMAYGLRLWYFDTNKVDSS